MSSTIEELKLGSGFASQLARKDFMPELAVESNRTTTHCYHNVFWWYLDSSQFCLGSDDRIRSRMARVSCSTKQHSPMLQSLMCMDGCAPALRHDSDLDIPDNQGELWMLRMLLVS